MSEAWVKGRKSYFELEPEYQDLRRYYHKHLEKVYGPIEENMKIEWRGIYSALFESVVNHETLVYLMNEPEAELYFELLRKDAIYVAATGGYMKLLDTNIKSMNITDFDKEKITDLAVKNKHMNVVAYLLKTQNAH